MTQAAPEGAGDPLPGPEADGPVEAPIPPPIPPAYAGTVPPTVPPTGPPTGPSILPAAPRSRRARLALAAGALGLVAAGGLGGVAIGHAFDGGHGRGELQQVGFPDRGGHELGGPGDGRPAPPGGPGAGPGQLPPGGDDR